MAKETKETEGLKLNIKQEIAKIDKLGKAWNDNLNTARELLPKYCAATIENPGNADLLRHFYEVAPQPFKPLVARFVSNVIPWRLARKALKDDKGNKIGTTISFVKDKKVVAEKGVAIINATAFETPFDQFKPERKEVDKNLAMLTKEYLRKVELLGDKASELGETYDIFRDVTGEMTKFHKRLTKLLGGTIVEAVEGKAPLTEEEYSVEKRKAIESAQSTASGAAA